jgi:hypothetical protein
MLIPELLCNVAIVMVVVVVVVESARQEKVRVSYVTVFRNPFRISLRATHDSQPAAAITTLSSPQNSTVRIVASCTHSSAIGCEAKVTIY